MIHIYDSVGIAEMSGPVKNWAALATPDGKVLLGTDGAILVDITDYENYIPVEAEPRIIRTEVPRIVEVDDDEATSGESGSYTDPTDPDTFTTYKVLVTDDGKAILTSDGSYILMGITTDLSSPSIDDIKLDAPKDYTNGEWRLLADDNGNVITTDSGNGILIFRKARRTKVIYETIETIEYGQDNTKGNYYRSGDVDYDRNGDTIINPISCDLDAIINGDWVLTLVAPIDPEGRYKKIVDGAVIGCPTWISKKQLFRIYDTQKSLDGVTAKARPIFMDSGNEVFILDTRPTNVDGQRALDMLLSRQNIYKGSSNISKLSTAYYQRKNLTECLMSSDDNSFINRWGGEVNYDNYTIHIDEKIGLDKGMMVSSYFNASGMESEIDTSDVVTRIVPTAYNGRMMSGKFPWVDSPNIKKYPIVHTKTIAFDDIILKSDAETNGYDTDKIICNGQKELDEELRKACLKQFEDGLDKPKVNYKVDLIDVSQGNEYEEFKKLLTVGLGDTIVCKNKALDIDTKSRVIHLNYDCVREQANSVELGDFSYDYFDAIKSAAQKIDNVVDGDGAVKASEISGVIDGMKAMLRVQQTAAKRQDCKAVLYEDLDPKSRTYGAMCIGSGGFEIADQKDGSGEWIWKTFGTAKGFVADLIVAGLLASKNFNPSDPSKGGFGWNLDTGDLYANNGHFSGTFSNRNDSRRAGTEIQNGEIRLNSDGNNTYLPALARAYITPPDGNGISYVDLNSIIQAVSSNDKRKNPKVKVRINGRTALSGKVEFSNGTYMQFVDGVLVGGNTMQGGF